MRRKLQVLALAVGLALPLAACAATNTEPVGGAGAFPLTVENCGPVTIERPPQRVLLITRYSAPVLEAVGVLDKVVAKSGNFPPELYSESTRTALAAIPTIGGAETTTGDAEVSLEAVLGQNPDLVIGPQSGAGVTREALAQSGIPYLTYSVTNCPDPSPL